MSAQTRPPIDPAQAEGAAVADTAASVSVAAHDSRPAKAMSRPNARPAFTAQLRKWHQRFGLAASLFLIWLGSSGAILSRSDQFGFDAMRVRWDWLTALYGLNAEAPRIGFEAQGHWMAATRESTLLDARVVEPRIPPPIGFVPLAGVTGRQLVIGTSESLVIVGENGVRVDELRAPILPVASLRRIGTTADGGIAVQDFDAFESRDGGNTWVAVLPQSVKWSQPAPLPGAQRKAIEQFAKPSVLVEQVLIDLHSGRLFGPIGAWIITLVGVLALGLSISGVWSWWRIRQSRQRAVKRG
ncbi:MAG: PepSY-associated TM helix domain-containing protein [Nevskia sp.]|nr:PepSY-associated TM helix domain-containing protein [Nevskia sp.]